MDRVADLARDLREFVDPDFTIDSRNQRNPGLLGGPPRRDFVAHGADCRCRRTDERDPGGRTLLGELGILGQEAVTRVHRVAAVLFGDFEDTIATQVTVARRGATDRNGMGGSPHRQCAAVDLGVHRQGLDPEFVRGPNHAHRDLAAIGDEQATR